MELKIGNILDTKCDVIAHAVNCMGVMGSGLALQIKTKYPEIYEKYKNTVKDLNNECLGGELLLLSKDKTYISNLFTQYFYKGQLSSDSLIFNGIQNDRYTDYEAVYKSLLKLKNDMIELGLSSVAFPYKMCSDRGGADWTIILTMIKSIFNNDSNIKVEIWKLGN